MSKGTRLLFWVAVLWVVTCVQFEMSLACRYNIRETGFVDLGWEDYLLCCYVGQDTPGDFVAAFETRAGEVFSESTVDFQVINVDIQKNHPSLKVLQSLENRSLPTAVLISPGQLSRQIALPTVTGSLEQALQAKLAEVISSPLRETLVQQVAEHYAVVLLIEGQDTPANVRATQAALTAIESINSQLRFMPKPITRGPVLVTLKRDSRVNEEILLWSLGLPATIPTEPHAVVLYGKMRWMGPLLEGREISEEVLYNVLFLVGADCECGIDPRLVRGTLLPVRWDRETEAKVTADLGFDPANPLVMTEVSQIMRMRASFYPGSFSPPANPSITIDDLPVPFVEDENRQPSDSNRESPVLTSLWYTTAVIVSLVLIVGVVMVLRSAKRAS